VRNGNEDDFRRKNNSIRVMQMSWENGTPTELDVKASRMTW
jgi:hypothetical protein